jgi:hypothetical protein
MNGWVCDGCHRGERSITALPAGWIANPGDARWIACSEKCAERLREKHLDRPKSKRELAGEADSVDYFRSEVRRCEDVLNRARIFVWDTTDEGIKLLVRECDELRSALQQARTDLTKACLERDSLKVNRELPSREARESKLGIEALDKLGDHTLEQTYRTCCALLLARGFRHKDLKRKLAEFVK